jgi:hypothetical protein
VYLTPDISHLSGTFHAKKTNRWRGQNLDFDKNWSVYWKIHKQFNAKFLDFSFNWFLSYCDLKIAFFHFAVKAKKF